MNFNFQDMWFIDDYKNRDTFCNKYVSYVAATKQWLTISISVQSVAVIPCILISDDLHTSFLYFFRKHTCRDSFTSQVYHGICRKIFFLTNIKIKFDEIKDLLYVSKLKSCL